MFASSLIIHIVESLIFVVPTFLMFEERNHALDPRGHQPRLNGRNMIVFPRRVLPLPEMECRVERLKFSKLRRPSKFAEDNVCLDEPWFKDLSANSLNVSV